MLAGQVFAVFRRLQAGSPGATRKAQTATGQTRSLSSSRLLSPCTCSYGIHNQARQCSRAGRIAARETHRISHKTPKPFKRKGAHPSWCAPLLARQEIDPRPHGQKPHVGQNAACAGSEYLLLRGAKRDENDPRPTLTNAVDGLICLCARGIKTLPRRLAETYVQSWHSCAERRTRALQRASRRAEDPEPPAPPRGRAPPTAPRSPHRRKPGARRAW